MIMAGHTRQKFVAYPIQQLDDDRAQAQAAAPAESGTEA